MSLRASCLRILHGGSLAAKLEPPDPSDADPGPPRVVPWPRRDPGLELRSGVAALPRPGTLGDPLARARCLARFAHHELMAIELFAWALLAWPELPGALRAALAGVLADEQRHCRMYLERLRAHGDELCDHPLSDYFWKHAAAIARSPFGPQAFFCAMGLTFEQANLDFTLLYRDGLRAGGDEASARVCQRVHDDEIEHVALAARALRQLAPRASQLESYTRAVPFPLAAARAKGRRFDAAARRRAGLDADFVAHVRAARSSQEQYPGAR